MEKKKKKNPAAVALAKKRAESLTPERRQEIARKAIKKRWDDLKKKKALSTSLKHTTDNS